LLDCLVSNLKPFIFDSSFKQTKNMTNSMIYPELGQTTNAEIRYTCSYSGGFYVKTSLKLSGRGIKPSGSTSYHVTESAMAKLKSNYSTCYEASL
jgi:hypothetical protein